MILAKHWKYISSRSCCSWLNSTLKRLSGLLKEIHSNDAFFAGLTWSIFTLSNTLLSDNPHYRDSKKPLGQVSLEIQAVLSLVLSKLFWCSHRFCLACSDHCHRNRNAQLLTDTLSTQWNLALSDSWDYSLLSLRGLVSPLVYHRVFPLLLT